MRESTEILARPGFALRHRCLGGAVFCNMVVTGGAEVEIDAATLKAIKDGSRDFRGAVMFEGSKKYHNKDSIAWRGKGFRHHPISDVW